jgi:hypothetical protein
LGHGADTISVPAVTSAQHWFLAENAGADLALLHTLRYDAKRPGAMVAVGAAQRINGQVLVPMQDFGRRLLVATERGRIQAYEFEPDRAAQPLRRIAETDTAAPTGTLSHVLFSAGQLWVADHQLARYELQVARGQFAQRWINYKGDTFLTAPQRMGSALIVLRQRAGALGVTAAAAQIDDDGNRRDGQWIWQTDLAVPPAAAPIVQRAMQEIHVVSGNGALFGIGREELRDGMARAPRMELSDPSRPPLTESLVLDEARLAFTGDQGGSDLIVYDMRQAADRPLERLPLDLQGQTLSVPPVAVGNHLVAPCASGMVFLLDSKTGKAAAAPFLPALAPADRVQWLPLAPLPGGAGSILADRQGNLFRLELILTPAPHLASARQQQVDQPIVAPPVASDSNVWLVVRGDGGDELWVYDVNELQRRQQGALPGRCVWGPYVTEAGVLLQTDQQRLICWDASSQRFDVELQVGRLIGPPRAYGRGWAIASMSGHLMVVESGTGRVQADVEIGETLGSGPVHFSADRFVVVSGDGTLHVVALTAK